MAPRRFWKVWVALAAVAGSFGGSGCRSAHDIKAERDCCKPPQFNCCTIPDVPVPKELNKVSLPPYIVETPDVLQIEAIRVVPLPPFRLEPLDVLYLSAENDFDQNKLTGLYPVDPDGTINLGPRYGGALRVADMTVEEAQKAIEDKARIKARNVSVTVSLAQSHGVQQISGQHIVRPDGTVGLGAYGSVYVAGLSLAQVKQAIESHLSKYLVRPEVAVDVYSYNSKFYYVITDFAGNGEQVTRLPHTGNETVLDAVSLIGGLSAVSSKKIWVARPAPTEAGNDQILPVDWCGITRKGQVKTNYQILPSDRIYILSQPLSKFDTYFARVLSPVQRTLGVALLAGSVNNQFRNNGNNGNVGIVAPIIP
ncbi:polysaccharide export protein : Polysaccharide export protein OS=Rhodopirellula maiorica SM1 GN=RMSM_04496 PE=4 SV=1: Poly_export: Poly_export [Gemmata massiliana]|uniref:Polysaccharide export protein N-terminal domain-containing protein n=1 Tax=Gemmata massiliana TaxID=1210884 RepID=A0A6P2DGH6_9BACT|nr:polysaccharide biosynthesis/export family protein [Gemmata massiliana]VTS00029.1 polysaccharide export protein : Polysaccharide export protein OS=Rhodopirellula maiorica SM1 GN=RMSM_04496 PE=4 SV=1: Poly_export: Poly_export [Gemmata massiliana]